jgi:UDP-glucose 4-epimerase
MAKCLVLGGAGFIGSNLVRRLIENGDEVRVFSRPTMSLENLRSNVEKVELVSRDFLDDVAIKKATKDIDIVYHLISTTFPSMTIESSAYDTVSNLLPTIRLVEACIANRVKKIVYASSGGTVYGSPLHLPIREDHPLIPLSAYGQSKLTIENHLSFYSRVTDLEMCILRVSNPYGPNQKTQSIQGLVAVAMGCLIHNRALKIYGDGRAIRDYLFIDDVVDAMWRAANTPGSHILNVSSAEGRSVMDVIASIERVSGRIIDKAYIDERPGDVSVNILDNTKAYDVLGWKPKTDFESGIRLTWGRLKNGISSH